MPILVLVVAMVTTRMLNPVQVVNPGYLTFNTAPDPTPVLGFTWLVATIVDPTHIHNPIAL